MKIQRIVRIYYRSEGDEILCCHSEPLSIPAAYKLAAEHQPWSFVDAKGPSDVIDIEILRVVCVKDRPRYGACTCAKCRPVKHDARFVVLPSQRDQIRICDQGSLIIFESLTAEAHEWLQDNVEAEDWQWSGNTLAVDRRMAPALIQAIEERF